MRLEREERKLSLVIALGLVAALVASGDPAARAENRDVLQPASEGGQASDRELELLRRLLGVPAPETAAPAARSTKEEPAAVHPTAVEPPRPEADKRQPPPPVPGTLKKKPPVPKPRATPAPRTAPVTTKSSTTTSSTVAAPVTSSSLPAPAAAAPDAVAEPSPDREKVLRLPASGTVVSILNVEEWKPLLGPSVQWSIERGATVEVGETRPMPLEPEREVATQRYHAQVQLADDKRSIRN
ncbi:MAG: hypothetical protein ABR587_13160, partial [Candidatus Binatia bacterium]